MVYKNTFDFQDVKNKNFLPHFEKSCHSCRKYVVAIIFHIGVLSLKQERRNEIHYPYRGFEKTVHI